MATGEIATAANVPPINTTGPHDVLIEYVGGTFNVSFNGMLVLSAPLDVALEVGGTMAHATDHAGIQFRTLNLRKGTAVRATRAELCPSAGDAASGTTRLWASMLASLENGLRQNIGRWLGSQIVHRMTSIHAETSFQLANAPR